MQKKVVGKQIVDYVSRKTNLPVQGVTLHCVGTEENVQGLSVETIYISNKSKSYDTCMNLPIESKITVSYNRWGNIDTVELCK